MTSDPSGFRPHLEYINSTFGGQSPSQIAGIQRRTVIHVYAEQGETLHLAASMMDANYTASAARIIARAPMALRQPSCPIRAVGISTPVPRK
ncbi:MAG: hypothetical protein HC876_11320 [Chloroflexaceae bacterium]|nr:hypothetical protein [Chloroflexaceae bacterium]